MLLGTLRNSIEGKVGVCSESQELVELLRKLKSLFELCLNALQLWEITGRKNPFLVGFWNLTALSISHMAPH